MRCFHFYIDDWLASKKIGRMDAHEERAYLRLLLHAATEPDCGLPTDQDELADIGLLGDQWYQQSKDEAKRFKSQTSGSKILACFAYLKEAQLFNAQTNQAVEPHWQLDVSQLREDRFYNQRLLREFQYQKEKSAKNSASGKLGAEAKQRKRKETEVDEKKRTPVNSQRTPEESERTLEKDKQPGQRNASNDVCVCVWVCVSDSASEEVNKLLNGEIEIDLNNPIQTSNATEDLYLPELMAAANMAKIGFSPAEAKTLRNGRWQSFSAEKRRNAVQGILDRLRNGEYDARPPWLKNYIYEEHWDRPLRAKDNVRSINRKNPTFAQALARGEVQTLEEYQEKYAS